MTELAAGLQRWAAGIHARHGVDPWVFLGLMAGCAPLFYYSIYRLGRAAFLKDAVKANLWGAIFLASTALPYVYVILFGRNLPWYVYLVLAALIVQGVWSLLRKKRQRSVEN